MKLEIQTKKLKEVVGLVEKTAGKHATLPILSCLLVEVGKNTVTFRSTNLDVGVEVVVSAKTTGEGSVAVPARTFSTFIFQLPDQNQTTTIEVDQDTATGVASGNLLIQTTQSKGVIKTVPPEDFPAIPVVSDGQEFELPADVIVKGLKSVWYSSSVSGIKPELSSVYLYRDGDYITFVATDSFRLAEKKVKAPNTVKLNDILIPFKNISDIIRTLESIGGKVTVKVNKNLISFSEGQTTIVSRIIDGVFPDYKQIIPKSFITEIVALKQDIIDSLKLSNIFSDKFNQVRLVVDPKKKICEVQTKNSDVGENKTSISAALTGEPIEVNFNYKYIVDCFQSIEADSVSLQLSGPNKPMVIRPVSSDSTFMYIVMPMNR